jgi:hypothetical protein
VSEPAAIDEKPASDRIEETPMPTRDRHVDTEHIARKAYERFEARGCEPGFDQQDCLDSERKLTLGGTE